MYRDIARLIAQKIDDSRTYTRFTQVCRASRDACRELLEEQNSTPSFNERNAYWVRWLPSSKKTIRHGCFKINQKTGYYKDDKFHSIHKVYDPSNKILLEQLEYSNGLLHGVMRKYSREAGSRELVYRCEYSNNQRHGREWKKGKNPNGQTFKQYFNGVLVYILQYNRHGNVMIDVACTSLVKTDKKKLIEFGSREG